jgi:serine/threonine protein kinase
MSPEVLEGTDLKANPAIDIWALGIMLYCMVFFKYPFNGKEADEVKEKVISAKVRFPEDTPCTEEFKDLIEGMLLKDHSKRYDLYTI